MRVKAKLWGGKRLVKKLLRIPREIRDPLRKEIHRAGQWVVNYAKMGMKKTSKQSEPQRRYHGGKAKLHYPSKPHHPPAIDTGQLVSDVHLRTQNAGLEAVVGCDELKALWLEFGTEHMTERPFLRPAFQKAREEKQIAQRIIKATNKVLQRAGKK